MTTVTYPFQFLPLKIGIPFLPDGGEFHWSWGKKLRHINTECGTKRVRLALPCGIFIGGGYVFQETEQRGAETAA